MLPALVATVVASWLSCTVTLTVFLSYDRAGSRLCKSRTLSKPIFTSAAALFAVWVTYLYSRLRPRIRECLGRTCPALPSARGRDGALLQLHGAARLPILDGRHSQISAHVWGVCRGIDDLADWPHGSDDLCAGGIRHELRKRPDLPCSISVRSQDELVGLGRFETSDGSLQHLREPLVEQ